MDSQGQGLSGFGAPPSGVGAPRADRLPPLRGVLEDGPGLRGTLRWLTLFFARRKLAFGLVLGGLLVTDLVVAATWPPTYRAQATVAVEPASLPEDVKPLVPSVHERIGRLTGLTLADGTLLELTHACPTLAEPRWVELDATRSPVQRLRDRITLSVEGRGDRSQLIRIGVAGESAAEVALVANRLAAKLIGLDETFRRDVATAIHSAVIAASVFDERPLREVETSLEKLRAENPLVATTSDAAIRAQALELETRAVEDEVAQVELASTVPLLESEAARWGVAVREQAEAARRSAAVAAEEKARPHVATPSPDDLARRTRLEQLEQQLTQLLAHCTEQNPDVRRVRREIALEEQRLGVREDQAEEAPWSAPPAQAPRPDAPGSVAPKTDAPSDAPKTDAPKTDAPKTDAPQDGAPAPAGNQAPRVGRRVDPGDPVRPASDERGATDVRFLLEAPGYPAWREAMAKVEAARSRLEALRSRSARRSDELKRLRALLDTLPSRRLEIKRLEEDRDRLSKRIDEARARRAAVERSYAAEVGGLIEGARPERLALVEAAPRPETPLGPDRPWLFLLGLLLALPLALVAAYVRDVRDRSYHSDDEVVAHLDVPVLGVIPRVRGRR